MPSDGSLQVWPKTLVCQHVEDHLSAIFSYSICSFFLYLSNSFSIRQFSSSIKQSRSLINLRLIVSKVCTGLSSFRVRRVLKKRCLMASLQETPTRSPRCSQSDQRVQLETKEKGIVSNKLWPITRYLCC